MSESARRVLELLELEPVERNLYRGRSESRGQMRLFGGQVLAQALKAAYHTLDFEDGEPERHAHSVHAYFLRAGSAERPVLFEVDRIRDGRSFATRRVVAIQEGRAIFNMDVSFHVHEQGLTHADMMPNVPPPEELEDDVEVVARLDAPDPMLGPMAGVERPYETRSVFRPRSAEWGAPRRWSPVWLRFRLPIDADDRVSATCVLAYGSDMGLVSTALLPHGAAIPRRDVQMASLDHALWIHRTVPVNQWLLFHKRTTTATGARGLIHAEFFAEDGTLVASVSQEGLIRVRA